MKGTDASIGQPHVLEAMKIRLETSNGRGKLTESWKPQPMPKVKGTIASNGQPRAFGARKIRLKTNSECGNLTES